MISALPASATVYMTVGQALKLAFPECEIERRTIYLTAEHKAAAEGLARVKFRSAIVYAYVALKEGGNCGVAYFDKHIVRTHPETIMVAVDSSDRVRRIELLVFEEPPEYIPAEAWYRQFDGRALDSQLAVRRGIRGVLGATLTTRGTTDAVRRMMAIHHAIKDKLLP